MRQLRRAFDCRMHVLLVGHTYVLPLIMRVPAYRDGGDCCPSTCQATKVYGCESANCYSCLDPNTTQPCVNSCTSSWVGDGYCDVDLNRNETACDW